MLIPRLLWPLLIYDVTMCTVEAIERKISTAMRKWLGVPPSLTDVALYCKKAKLVLPFKSVAEEYKAGKARLAMMLQDSVDPTVQKSEPKLRTGRKWKAKSAVDNAQAALRLKEVMGATQSGRQGFNSSEGPWWSQASPRERREMVVQEVREAEDERRVQKAAQQSQQGQWTAWSGALQRSLTWGDVWRMAPLRLSFAIRSMYDLMPSAANLVKWKKTVDDACPLCSERQTLEHVLSSCSVALGQHRYTWRHNVVLKALAAVVDRERLRAKSKVETKPAPKRFVKAGQRVPSKKAPESVPSFLDGARDWKTTVDLVGHDEYPEAIRVSKLRPDLVLFSHSTKQFVLLELTVPWEAQVGS